MEIPLPGSKTAGAVVIALSTAVQRSQRVRLDYESWSGRQTERKVDPYGLVYRAGYWYMAGYCHLRQDLRTFRLDRVVSVTLEDETFTRPAELRQALRRLAARVAALAIGDD